MVRSTSLDLLWLEGHERKAEDGESERWVRNVVSGLGRSMGVWGPYMD